MITALISKYFVMISYRSVPEIIIQTHEIIFPQIPYHIKMIQNFMKLIFEIMMS